MTEDRDGGDDERVLELIAAGVMAGADHSLAREVPDARRGLMKMAAKHSARVAALADQIFRESAENTPSPFRTQ